MGEDAPLEARESLFPYTYLSRQDRAHGVLDRSGDWFIRSEGRQGRTDS